MFDLFLAIAAVLVLLGFCAHVAVTIRLSRLDVRGEKLAWWSYRSGDQVPATYKQLFPRSRLPLLRHLPFYLLIGFAGVVLVARLWK